MDFSEVSLWKCLEYFFQLWDERQNQIRDLACTDTVIIHSLIEIEIHSQWLIECQAAST